MPRVMSKTNPKLTFNTAIITYPSDYDGLLTLELIISKFKSIANVSTKIVIAREDPDEEIQRIHYHLYWDDDKRKTCTTEYFDIKLTKPVVVFIKENGNRDYKLYTEIASQLGIDNYQEMAPKLDSYLKEEEKENYVKWDYLDKAHPNIQLKKHYGDKYLMLRYVLKQKLLVGLPPGNQIHLELQFLTENYEQLCERAVQLIEENQLHSLNLENVLDELIDLCKKYKKRQANKEKAKKRRENGVPLLQYKAQMMEIDIKIKEFKGWLREQILSKNLTKNEILHHIYKNPDMFEIFSGSYINYSKLINDMFKGRSPAKPTRHYEYKFWLPIKLYDYLMWLDDWVMKWYTGKPLEHRPKGICLIGNSRTGKTTLMSLLGDFSYFKNVWNLDNWEAGTAYTIMDDMDAADEGRGLSFSWFKPFFGAQDAITITDKFKPKQDIFNGKPLIWLNNYDLNETFKSETAQDYIRRNMEIVYIHKPLKESPVGMETFQYKLFDPTTTWFYQNKILPQQQEKENETLTSQQQKQQCLPLQGVNNVQFTDETEKTIQKCQEEYDDNEPLNERRKRLLTPSISDDELITNQGRPSKRIRRENTM